jgi:MarR-like DNA-binding transcriptional regulator SgrR of sgrS sRNA
MRRTLALGPAPATISVIFGRFAQWTRKQGVHGSDILMETPKINVEEDFDVQWVLWRDTLIHAHGGEGYCIFVQE